MGCNFCKSDHLREAARIPNQPISKDYSGSDERFDLILHYCDSCGLLQIREPIPPPKLYDSQFYITGFHQPKHIDDLITCALQYKDPGKLIEIGCNDGSLLKSIAHYGFTKFAGIEPNRHAYLKANALGAIYNDYLSLKLAKGVTDINGKFDFVVCRHVAEHVSDLESFFVAIDELMAPDGVLILEFPNTDMGFDSVSPVILFEEHVNHFTERFLDSMVPFYGFEIMEKRHYTFGGGSIALVCQKSTKRKIRAFGNDFTYYQNYFRKLDDLKILTQNFIEKHADHKIVLYGAASRSSMFINVMGIADKINFVFDDRKELHGLMMPGTKIKITAPLPIEGKTLALLGVGCEHESKIAQGFSVSLSLFSPRFGVKSFFG